MEGIDTAILQGRDPPWRTAWEQELDDDERARVEACIADATRMTDPRLAPFVLGRIARSRRAVQRRAVVMLVLIAITFLSLVGIALFRPGAWRFAYVGVLVAELLIAPWLVTRPARRLDRARRAQGPPSVD